MLLLLKTLLWLLLFSWRFLALLHLLALLELLFLIGLEMVVVALVVVCRLLLHIIRHGVLGREMANAEVPRRLRVWRHRDLADLLQ